MTKIRKPVLEFLTKHLYLTPTRKYFNPELEGIENFPKRPSILVSNQTSGWDGPVITAEFVRQGLPWVDFAIMDITNLRFNKVMFGLPKRYLGAIGNVYPPTNGENVVAYYAKEIERRFAENRYFGMFPERVRIAESRLGKYHSLPFILAKELEAPLVPVFMDIAGGKEEGKTLIRIGRPVLPEEGYTRRQAKNLVVERTLELSQGRYSASQGIEKNLE